ncbi:MAG TPA: ATP-binding protein [Burkholderiales bacterium]|jgi:two-component system sensor histidine kinase PhoQ|nr:ATP-binding protein [Burkholderiales bacterium]
MRSLNARIAVGAGVVLAVFVAASAFALERAFRDSARGARQERLLAQVYLLMAVAEVDARGELSMGNGPAEPRLDQPQSGLYAWIVDGSGRTVWRSRSALSVSLPKIAPLPAAVQRFAEAKTAEDGQAYFAQSYGVSWNVGGRRYPFTFAVAEDLRPFEQQLNLYRRSLWGWLGAMAVLLLAAQWAILRWGLSPLRRVADDLTRVEEGAQQQLAGDYPDELRRLTDNLNALLAHERAQRKRYRDALADLAHSMKTPLALMRAALREARPDAALARALDEQVQRMDQIVAYHLQRAETAGRIGTGTSLALHPAIERVVRAMQKVHADKAARVDLAVDPALRVRVDEGDLTEMLGNLLDNAFKWCRSRIRIGASAHSGTLTLTVEDDGAGIAPADAERVLQRGARADQSVPGHGIGLALTRDIVEAYAGAIRIERSELGGAAVRLELPAAAR